MLSSEKNKGEFYFVEMGSVPDCFSRVGSGSGFSWRPDLVWKAEFRIKIQTLYLDPNPGFILKGRIPRKKIVLP